MYNLHLKEISRKINRKKAKRVLIQLPDGLKNKTQEIVHFLETNTKSEILIWLGNCFGGCDIPANTENVGVDLIIQFGHNKYRKEKEW